MLNYIEISNSNSPISFEEPISKGGSKLFRELCINKQSIFSYGPNCETCEFIINKCNHFSSSITVNELRDILNHHVEELSGNIINQIQTILPNGTFGVIQRNVKPKISSNDDFNFSKDYTYYEINKINIAQMVNISKLENYTYQELNVNEYILPIQENIYFNENVIKQYEQMVLKQNTPCAIAISILEIHGRDNWFTINLLHFILDGHHKIRAAANTNSSIKLLSFINCEQEYNILPFIINHWKHKNDISHVKKSINYLFANVV